MAGRARPLEHRRRADALVLAAVTGIVTRVVAEARGTTDRLAGLRKVPIDERADRKGQRYLTVVTDIETGRVVWAAEGRSKAVVGQLFTDLGKERAAALAHVGCDGADWIHTVVTAMAPHAVLCLDSFHAVAWASDAVDAVRRSIVRNLKREGSPTRPRRSRDRGARS